MYTRQQASQLRQSFWTSFGQYMTLHSSSEGKKISWLNYKTDVKSIRFKMDVEPGSATISIEISDPDPQVQKLYFERFLSVKNIMSSFLNEEWVWSFHIQDENNRTISRISRQIKGVDVFNKSDWPAIISFLKPRMIALDGFWNSVKDAFTI
jgi:hypothetical protein